ncbi:TetR/AcrR family transcriptional regulator [Corynebacterium canis]|uniref:TetR/AcrR family transcriptional regulator n=1 Tax=Corynebacterium canis TaxID=679663 RepID=A0A5C5UES8_9CORY|nr:TetR/AcrR family transcriptional regulator [Corynebacterium canis]TWT24012.1 TetR/AcrR family transcriptional regulator [Corynebacterium canis]WJY75374.1 DNA-binding transcriptional repressor AcrR [Corynebacterium canis]
MEPAPEKLLQAARTEFLRNGYKKTSVADIAAAAGLAVGSVYKYYPSKKELFFDIYFAENAAVKDQAARTTDWDQPREAMMHVIHHFAAATQENKILQAWDDPKMGPELHAESLTRCQESDFKTFLAAQVPRWQEAGQIPPEFSSEFLEELLDTINQIEIFVEARVAIKQLIYEALLEKVFPLAGAGDPSVRRSEQQ